MTEDSGKTKKVFDGRYEILSIVGRGARSVVYRARNIQEPNTEVALKVLLSRKDGSSNSDRLRKEALAMVSSRHKYVIRLDDFHSLGDLCYLAMEFAPEADLKKYLAKLGGSLPLEQIEQFLLQILEGLSFIHQAGIIHRDLKPENILVIDESNVRIGDFGVAVLPGEKASFEELQKGVGTMDYMAPEVLEGISYEQCADVYSLGVTFYEIITGTHPFRNVSMIKQLEARQDQNLTDLRKLRPEIPEYLAAAIMRAMSYDPANRFPTGRQFLQALKGEKDLSNGRTGSRARKLTRNDREKLRSEIRSKKKEKPESESLEAALEAIFAETEAAAAEPVQPLAPAPSEVIAQAAPETPTEPTATTTTESPAPAVSAAPDPYLSRWANGGTDGKTIVNENEAEEVPNYDTPVQEPAIEELPEQEPEETPVTETDQVAQLGTKSETIKNVLIACGLIVLAFMIYQRLFGGSEVSEELNSDQGQIVSILPASSDEMAVFPKFSQGVYAGVLSGATPEGLVPLTIIALSSDEMVLMLGVQGFVPVRVKTAELAADAQSLIIRSGGISLELTGQIEGSKVSGWVRNIITHEEGAWSVQAVR